MANVFQEGQPLDVVQLNQMITDIAKLQGVFGSMTTAGSIVSNLLGPTVPIIDLGYIAAIKVSPGKRETMDLESLLARKFAGLGTPIVTVTPITELNNSYSISVSLYGEGINKKVYIINNGKTEVSVAMNWQAIYLKPISSS